MLGRFETPGCCPGTRAGWTRRRKGFGPDCSGGCTDTRWRKRVEQRQVAREVAEELQSLMGKSGLVLLHAHSELRLGGVDPLERLGAPSMAFRFESERRPAVAQPERNTFQLNVHDRDVALLLATLAELEALTGLKSLPPVEGSQLPPVRADAL